MRYEVGKTPLEIRIYSSDNNLDVEYKKGVSDDFNNYFICVCSLYRVYPNCLFYNL